MFASNSRTRAVGWVQSALLLPALWPQNCITPELPQLTSLKDFWSHHPVFALLKGDGLTHHRELNQWSQVTMMTYLQKDTLVLVTHARII